MGMLDYVILRTNETRERMRQRVIVGDIPRWLQNSRRFNYLRQVIVSVPPWQDREALRRVKERAQAITAMTGIDHHIAHIIPLNHPRVCGLTVPWNLEIQPAKKNLSASNHIQLDDQLALF